MRRQTAIWLMAVTMTGILAGCGQNSKNAETQRIENKKISISTEERYMKPSPLPSQVTRPEGDALSVESQLYTILQNRKKWQEPWGDSEYDGTTMHFAVTDFDQNGRLEILVSSGPQGSGTYTTNWLYQISGDGVKLKRCQVKDYFDQDIYRGIRQVVCEKDTGKYHYGCTDYIHLSGSENYSSIDLFTLAGDVIQSEGLGYCNRGDAAESDDFIYYQTFGKKKKKITKQEYTLEHLASQKYQGSEIKPVCIHWFQFTHSMQDVTDVQLMHELEKSWQRFGIGKKAEAGAYDDVYYEDSREINEMDWGAYQYQMSEEEFKGLWNYIPVLTGSEKVEIAGDLLTLEEYYHSEMPEISYLSVQDVTGDGIPELILDLSFTSDVGKILLSRQNQNYYLFDLYDFFQLDSEKVLFNDITVLNSGIIVFDDTANDVESYCEFKLENGQGNKTEIGRWYGSGDDYEYCIGGKKVSESAFDEWEEDLGDGVLKFPPIAKEG